jgi:peptidoglycan hydrolase-like protein with peptidoglycan-binding domain/DNA invertase Pin-like site-specific DNA recombinase
MRTTYWVPGARRRGISLAAGLALLCFAGTVAGSSPARAAEAPKADGGLLRIGDGYAHPQGSTPVRALQRRLRTLGLRPGPVDGLFGPRTKAAVESLQRAAGLQVDGIAGPHTRSALHRASAPLLGRGAGYDQRGGSLQVRRLQRQLRRLGLRPGPIDGLYGPRTAAAVARFQRAKGVAPDGVAWFGTRHAIASTQRSSSRRFGRDSRPTRESRRTRLRRESTRSQAAPSSTPRPPDAAGASRAEEKEPATFLYLALGAALLGLVALLTPPVAKKVAQATATRRTRRERGRSGSSERPLPRAVPDRTDAHEEATGVEAIGYVAVGEAGDEVDLERQMTVIDAECEKRGWRLVEVSGDVGQVSDEALDRSGLSHGLRRLAASPTRCLIVPEVRHLGRSAAGVGRVIGWMRERGMRLVAVDVGLDTGAPNGQIASDALVSAGQLEDRWAAPGIPRSRAAGDTRGGRPGRPAVEDLPELKEYIVALRSAGMTLQAIADRLNEKGVPTVRGGREWRPSSVQVAAGYRRPRPLWRAGGRGEEQRREDG